MTGKTWRRILLLACLLQSTPAVGQERDRRIARPPSDENLTVRPGTRVTPCAFTFAGKWFGSNGITYQFADRPDGVFTWSAPQIREQARGRCGGAEVFADWSGDWGQGRGGGAVQGPPGGPATVINWSNGTIFWRIPKLALRPDRTTLFPGETVNFRGESVPAIDGRYFIRYGDGQEDYFQFPDTAHSYGAPGVFEVTLAVIVNDQRFESPPITITVNSPPDPGFSTARLFLSVNPSVAAPGEQVELQASLEPEIQGAVYVFTFADQNSGEVSSPRHMFRCPNEGVWIARVSARLPSNQFLASEPVQVSVRAIMQRPPETGNTTGEQNGKFPWWVVPGLVGLVGAVGVYRTLRKKKQQREQHRMSDRVRFNPHSDTGTQCISPDPSRIRALELAFRLTRNRGMQCTEGLSITGERRRQ